MRFATMSAVVVLVAGPAFADCSREIQSLKEALTEAETGASSTATGLPATRHQEQVLAGNQGGDKAGVPGPADMPASPHQQKVLGEPAAGPAGASDLTAGQQAADLVAQAGDMGEAGDEEGCMQKVSQAKGLLGIE
jgi:hypothetical protein